MPITKESFEAFLNCETKSYLKTSGAVGDQLEFTDWQQHLSEVFTQECHIRLRSSIREDEYLSSSTLPEDLERSRYQLVFDCVVETQELKSNTQALERVSALSRSKHYAFIPIRFVPNEKVTKHDKLLLAFDALTLFTATGKMPLFGKLIYRRGQKAVKVQLTGLIKKVRSVVVEIIARQVSQIPPPPILNKHCVECEFQARCRQIAVEKDELTLLSGLTEKERKRQHNKGIFSITQLSYTFRPRRRPKRLASRPEKHNHALRALAIRERKIHIVGRPELSMVGTPVYLDVEGDPDRDFYYLIGLRFKCGEAYLQYSFWADDLTEEQEIWASFLRVLGQIETPQLIHYGSYETVFLRRMKARYHVSTEATAFLDRLIADAVNVVSVLYGKVYFPTYSNGLKEVANYLGFTWSDKSASGLSALLWRSKWEVSRDITLKQKLLTYNAEDCSALEKVVNALALLCERKVDTAASSEGDVVEVNSLKASNPYNFGKVDFQLPEFEFINQAAYWNYQRDRVYVKSNKRGKRATRKPPQVHGRSFRINKVTACPPPTCCPKCKATRLQKYGRMRKVVQDLKFTQTGIKRWIVKYTFDRHKCCHCQATFVPYDKPWTRHKFGSGLRSYLIYQMTDLQIPQTIITRGLNQLFNFDISTGSVSRQKYLAADLYKDCYDLILKRILNGKLIHADETKAIILGQEAFVWVITNMEDVAYFYTPTREGDTIQELLRGFKGVLVTDFYAAYDAIDCSQQKCLIHLIRDLNDDLIKNPFNKELKELASTFAALLKPMIETVDRFGLKARFLYKHQTSVDRFYKRLVANEYKSEMAIYYKKRFEKNHDRLFTFLAYDGVPWNNNNAEHAIKAFASLRRVIGGTSTEKGIKEYLTLLSICETCKYKGVDFLSFLRSGEKDIDEFYKR